MIEQNKCHGTEEILKERLDIIDENWNKLIECCQFKTQKLKEASDQKTFYSGVQDVDFWLGEVRLISLYSPFRAILLSFWGRQPSDMKFSFPLVLGNTQIIRNAKSSACDPAIYLA